MQGDLLSTILESMHVRSGVFGRLNAGDQWATPLSSPDAIKFCAATRGASWYCLEEQPRPRMFKAGDVLMVNSPGPLFMGSSAEALNNAVDPCPEPDEHHTFQYGQGCDFSMVSGGIDVDAEHRDMLRHGLPSIIHIQGTAILRMFGYT